MPKVVLYQDYKTYLINNHNWKVFENTVQISNRLYNMLNLLFSLLNDLGIVFQLLNLSRIEAL